MVKEKGENQKLYAFNVAAPGMYKQNAEAPQLKEKVKARVRVKVEVREKAKTMAV